jgi:hypothetical protein
MEYGPIHHGEPYLARRSKIYNLKMKEIACDKMQRATFSHVQKQKVHDPNFGVVGTSPI